MSDARLEAAETQISHLTRAVEDLSDQLVRQGEEVDRLGKRFQALLDRVSGHDGDEASDIPLLEQRPPHW
jgi:SlyX protein